MICPIVSRVRRVLTFAVLLVMIPRLSVLCGLRCKGGVRSYVACGEDWAASLGYDVAGRLKCGGYANELSAGRFVEV